MNHLKNNVFCSTAEILIDDGFKGLDASLGAVFYSIQLSKFRAVLPKLKRYLNTEENKRSERYYHTKDKERFIICRALLKYCICRHTGQDISTVILKKDTNKKPYLLNYNSLYFNVTHAGDFALIAIACSPVGIDIERLDTNFDYNEIVKNVCNKQELDALERSENVKHTFYKLWTRKEAIVKATGLGITDDFTDIPSLDGYHLMPENLLGQLSNIHVISFQFNTTYKGAIALSQKHQSIKTIIFNNLFLKVEEF